MERGCWFGVEWRGTGEPCVSALDLVAMHLLTNWWLICSSRQTAVYEQGVGLGASKAKEVTNFQGYREMARDSVSAVSSPYSSIELTLPRRGNATVQANDPKTLYHFVFNYFLGHKSTNRAIIVYLHRTPDLRDRI